MDRARYMELIEPIVKLMERKHEDYGSNGEGSVPLEAYFPFGDKSYVQMLHVKTLRLVSLTDSNKVPHHEKVVDTVKDLINYSIFYLDFLEREKHREL